MTSPEDPVHATRVIRVNDQGAPGSTFSPYYARRAKTPVRPPPSPRPRRAEIPKLIIKVSSELFAERGFENTSVQDIVLAAHVTKGALYHYFSSKDDILFEIYAHVLHRQMNRLTAIADSDRPVLDRINDAAADLIDDCLSDMSGWAVFWRSTHLLRGDRQDLMRAERRRYRDRFLALLEEARDNGDLLAFTDLDVALNYFFGAVHHLWAWYRAEGRLSAAGVGEQFGILLLRSIAARELPPAAMRPPGATP